MYIVGRILEIKRLTCRIKAFTVEVCERVNTTPGQFMMVWIPQVGEIPLSIAYKEDRLLEFIVAKVGRVTGHMHDNLSKGDRLAIRGPYGRGFTLRNVEKCLMIAGGYGLAPLLYLSHELKRRGTEIDVALGFRTREDVFYTNRFDHVADHVWVFTEDGSYGIKGMVTEVMKKHVKLKDYDIVYTCGPELMMFEVVKHCLEQGVKVEASLERVMKCGIGICGSCILDPLGLRVCKDGPVFDGEVLMKINDFGRYWRCLDGRKVPIKSRFNS
ncbi:MAG: dihydroorotate dehydrogenase electron transfer subunit [Thermoprotei archaeon]|nr:MAG: dihydroorotate dehydrogenase electron transfer subunit [Thermoprotei archaeon]RLF24717.1 MAG: dihydroorotate dehydrogenase electron transfer subunit [Thermoprotei archaeon]